MQAGTVLGPYRIDSELGVGGMGKVYAAVAEGNAPGIERGSRVALKVMHPHLLETPGFFKRFLREGEIGATIAHDNVVRTLDVDALRHAGDQMNFLVMEYVEGQTLRELLAELETVPEELCRHIGRETCKGLAAIHAAGVVHRDMKPDNVLITEEHVVKIMDLGVARSTGDALRLSQTGAFVGSLHYAAPEQFRDDGKDLDGRADLHALGLVLYELACGVSPYDADDLPGIVRNVLDKEPRRLGEVNPQISPFLEEVVHRLLQKDREERFASAQELLLVLEEGEESSWWRERSMVLRIETQRPLRRIRIPRETAVYGREEELGKLAALHEAVSSGEGHVVLIEGEAGIGKSRLVDEFVGRLQQRAQDINFLCGGYPPGGSATGAGGFAAAFSEQLGDGGAARYLTDTPLLVPAFEALLRGETTPKGEAPLTKDSLQTCFVHALRALGAERTTIVLIEDLHFAPEQGLALFSALAQAVAGQRILLLATVRRGPDEAWVAGLQRAGNCVRMPLSRLGPKDLFALLSDSFRSERLARDLGMKIAVKSDGNPYFAFEIIRSLREEGFIRERADGRWITSKVIEQIYIPSTVQDLIQARMVDLDEEEKDLLDIAACCGFDFDPLLVAAALGIGAIPVMKRLARIEAKHRLVRSVGRRCVFDHHQVQRSLYAGLPELLREAYHGTIGEALERLSDAESKDPAELDDLAVDLCEQFLSGPEKPRALRYLEAAIARLNARYQGERALSLAERALAAPDLVTGPQRVRVLLHLAVGLDMQGRRDAQRAAVVEADELAKALDDTALEARTARALGRLLHRTSQYEEAEQAYLRSRDAAKAAGDAHFEAAVAGSLGILFHDRGRFEDARAEHERHLALTREIGHLRGQAVATGNLGRVYDALGRYDEALEMHERDLAISRDLGDRHGEAMAGTNLGSVLYSLCRYEEAREQFERSLSLSHEIGLRRGEAIATGNLGAVLLSLGERDEARQRHERYLELSREIGYRQGEAIAMGNLGRVHQAAGHYALAQEAFQRSLDLAIEIGDRQREATALRNRAGIERLLGAPDEAEALDARSLALAREIGYRRGEGCVLVALGRHRLALGDTAQATEHLAAARELTGALGDRDGQAESEIGLAVLDAAQGRVEEARARLASARDLASASGAAGLSLLAACHTALLDEDALAGALAAYRDLGPRAEHGTQMEAAFLLWQATNDIRHLSEARCLLALSLEHAPEAQREQMVAANPLHRAVVSASS